MTILRGIGSEYREVVGPFESCDPEALAAFDALIFPPNLCSTVADYQGFRGHGGIAVSLYDGQTLIGFAFGLPSEEVADDFKEDDPNYCPSPREFYSYSEAVHLAYAGRGLGRRLLLLFAEAALQYGFYHLGAHVRTRTGWHNARARILGVNEKDRRMCYNMWPNNPEEIMEFQWVSLFDVPRL